MFCLWNAQKKWLYLLHYKKKQPIEIIQKNIKNKSMQLFGPNWIQLFCFKFLNEEYHSPTAEKKLYLSGQKVNIIQILCAKNSFSVKK